MKLDEYTSRRVTLPAPAGPMTSTATFGITWVEGGRRMVIGNFRKFPDGRRPGWEIVRRRDLRPVRIKQALVTTYMLDFLCIPPS